MKIVAVNHKFKGDQISENYYSKLAEALKYNPDILVGPDYAITSFNSDGTINFETQAKDKAKLEKLSYDFPETLIVPGTWPVLLDGSKMSHEAPIYRNGEQIANFKKQTDVENSGLAEQNELEWQRGEYDNNNIMHQGKKIALEICSDHGKQPIDRDTFLELILTRDLNSGFYLNASNDDFSRYAIVNDSEIPQIAGYKYDLKNRDSKLSFIGEQRLNSFLTCFNLE